VYCRGGGHRHAGCSRGTAQALELFLEYFREYREAVVIERVKADGELLDRVYALVTRKGR